MVIVIHRLRYETQKNLGRTHLLGDDHKFLAERAGPKAERIHGVGIGTILPRVSTNSLSGLLEAVFGAPYDGEADLPVIAAALQVAVDDLFPVAETLQMLRFAEIEGGDIRLMQEGKDFAVAGLDGAQTPLCPTLADAHRSGGPYPADPRRTPEPQGAAEPVLG